MRLEVIGRDLEGPGGDWRIFYGSRRRPRAVQQCPRCSGRALDPNNHKIAEYEGHLGMATLINTGKVQRADPTEG
jgi:hypothetical protein